MYFYYLMPYSYNVTKLLHIKITKQNHITIKFTTENYSLKNLTQIFVFTVSTEKVFENEFSSYMAFSFLPCKPGHPFTEI
jgi:hypothetical protein